MAFLNNRLAIRRPLDLSGLSLPHLACSAARRVISSYVGPLLRLRRDVDNDELDIGQKAGALDLEQAKSFVGGGEAFCVTLYDQSGNGWHLAESTAGNQPFCYDAAFFNQGGFPMIQVGASTSRFRVATDNASNNGCVALASYLNAVPAATGFLFDDDDTVGVLSAQVQNPGDIYTQTGGGAATDTGFNISAASRFLLVCNFQSDGFHRVLFNGSVNDFNHGATGVASGMVVGRNGLNANPCVHSLHEIIWYNGQLSDAQLGVLNANMNAYYKVY